jgi:uncharacterized FlaG/YvyC family protein
MDMAITNINATGTKVSDIPVPGSAPVSTSPKMEPSGKAPEDFMTLDNEAIKQLIDEIQTHLQSMNISLSFSTYGKNKDNIAVVVKDNDTGKVIREIPAKELQNLYTKLGELIGLIFNDTA